MARKLVHAESKLNYGQFLERRNLDKVRGFLQAKRELLARIQNEYGVPSEILAAVYMVETNLGSYLGKTYVFGVFVNMAASSDLDLIAPFLSSELLAGSRKEETQRRCQEKAQWAYDELLSLLIFCKRNGYDPTRIKGSVFGAFGRCQFLPSSALRYGVDADEDGKVDLFDEPEALVSMANYLRAYGWRGDLVKDEQAAVLYEYNRSQPYVKTILAMAERLRERRNTPAAQ
jgi:membrane-bound lytic murein transglycosylase B